MFAAAERSRGSGPDTFATLLGEWEDPQLVRRAIAEAEPAQAPANARRDASPLEALDRAASAAERARAAARPPLARPSGLSESDEEHASPDGDTDESLPARAHHARELARAVGTALHDVLERWSFRNPNTARALLRAAATRAARLASVSEEEVLAQAGPALDALLSSGLPAALGKLEVLGRELPLLFRRSRRHALERHDRSPLPRSRRRPPGGRRLQDRRRARPRRPRALPRGSSPIYARGVARLFPNELAPAAELVWLRSGQRERLPLESPA